MIKIFLDCLNNGVAEWEKDNIKYMCIRDSDGITTRYSLSVYNAPHLKIKSPIISESLAEINKRLRKTEVEIVED